MSKRTDTQLIILSRAASQDIGVGSRPPKMSKAGAAKIGAGLIERRLMKELNANPGQPVWREDEDGRAITIVITAKGRKAIGVVDDEQPAAFASAASDRPVSTTPTLIGKGSSQPRPTKARAGTAGVVVAQAREEPVAAPRTGSKQAMVIGMLRLDTGATLDALVEATGWLPHTTRAALTGLCKRRFAIERARGDRGTSSYRIVERVIAPASPTQSGAGVVELTVPA